MFVLIMNLCICSSLSALPFEIVDFIKGGGLTLTPTKWFPEEERHRPAAGMKTAKASVEQQDPHADGATHMLTVWGNAGSVSECVNV